MKNFKIHYQNGKSSLVNGDKFSISNYGYLYISCLLEEGDKYDLIFVVKPEYWISLEIIDIKEENDLHLPPGNNVILKK